MNHNTSKFIGKSHSEITDNDIRDYLVYLVEEKQSATSTVLSQKEVAKNISSIDQKERDDNIC